MNHEVESAGVATMLNAWARSYDRVSRTPLSERRGLLDWTASVVDATQAERVLDSLKTLQQLGSDADAMAATLAFGIVELAGQEPPEDLLGEAAASLLADLRRLKAYEQTSATSAQAEGLRRLLLALVKDLRVVLIAITWHLSELRFARELEPEAARSLADQTLMIYAPLANRLGIWQLKWELEDSAFRYLEPETYHRIAKLVAERRSDREQFIATVIRRLQEQLAAADIEADVRGRPKHIYSIWRKMQRKGLDFHELYDVRAVRVLVDDIAACYTVLGMVHGLWQPVPGEFDDYITNPKGNMYQSLHTAVVGPRGKVLEIQIRTHEMHHHAELGVAAHWRYKEGGPGDAAFEQRIATMRQLLEGAEDGLDDESLLDSFQALTTEERIYVLTPKGEVIDLPAGATVLDFAYHIHTEVGHRCRGAKINGRIVPLTQTVETGQRVEILTAKEAAPSRDWLNPRLGYVRGARARQKIRQWFRKANYDSNLAAGKEAVEAEFARLGLDASALDELPGKFHLKRLDDLFAAVGAGDLTTGQIANAVSREKPPETLIHRPARQRRERPAGGGDEVTIEDVGNLMTTMAGCCRPIPGDQIVGYITRGRGVTIHRSDCRQVIQLAEGDRRRLIQVNWGSKGAGEYTVRLRIIAFDRRELIKDLSTVLSTEHVSVQSMDTRRDEALGEVTIQVTVRVRDYGQLSDLLARLGSVQNVRDVRRLR